MFSDEQDIEHKELKTSTTVETEEDEVPKVPIIRYELFRTADAEALPTELWDVQEPIGQRVVNLINQVTILPKASLQTPVAAAYALIPSAMASQCFILFLHGRRGSGQSNLSELIAAIHGSQIQSVAIAALRNYINSRRWRLSDSATAEQNYCLIFDNLNSDTLSGNENLYTYS